MWRTKLRISAIGILIPALVIISSTTSSLGTPKPLIAMQCNIYCVSSYTSQSHLAFGGQPHTQPDDTDGGSHPSTLFAYLCCKDFHWPDPCKHPVCMYADGGPPVVDGKSDYDRLRAAASKGDRGEIAVLAREYSTTVIVNEQRRAVQVLSPCDPSTVLAHFPIASPQ
jgi:hypothetical protein